MIRGLEVLSDMRKNLERWMTDKGFHSIDDFLGDALDKIMPLEKLERRKLFNLRINAVKCIKCGICVKACPYDALRYEGSMNVPAPDQGKCDNCGLCVSICPTGAIGLEGGAL